MNGTKLRNSVSNIISGNSMGIVLYFQPLYAALQMKDNIWSGSANKYSYKLTAC